MSVKSSSLHLTTLVGGLAACSVAAALLVSGPLPTPIDHVQDAARPVQTARYQPAIGDSGPQTVRARNHGMTVPGVADPAAVEHCPRCR